MTKHTGPDFGDISEDQSPEAIAERVEREWIEATLASPADAPMTYLAKNLRSQLERGPAEGEDFFRLKVTGNGETNWLNVKPSQLVAIIEALGDAA